MRNILLASVATAALFTGSALAADLPVRGPAMAPAPVFLAMNWTGFYIGGQVGWTEGRDKASLLVPVIPGASQTYAPSSAIGGLYAGYNWQFNSMVFGLEADANLTGLSRNATRIGLFGPFPAGFNVKGESNFEGGLVAKVGVAFDNALLYVLGGVSIANLNVNYNGVGGSAGFDDTRFGWTVGAGVAYKFSPNWSARVEYRYSDFGAETHAVPVATPFFGGTQIRHAYTTQRVMVGLTYQFGGPAGPVVAKY